jgi:N,N'-diacetyllegionaminate synthase
MNPNFRQICLKDTAKSLSEGRCLIIGEVAQTHDGSLGQAHAFIDAIANTGADAVKFQTHIAAAESTPNEPWRVKFSPRNESRYEYWQRMEFSKVEWAGLRQHAEERGLLFLSSPFSMQAAEMLEEIGMQVWKLASGEINNIQLLNRIIALGKPIILSSGMSSWLELDQAIGQIRNSDNSLAVLQCTSAYPCPPEKIGLNMLEQLKSRYQCSIGLSDHSGNIYAGLAAATLGAEVLEVHVTLSRDMFGPDVPASVTTSELKQLVAGVRSIEKMLANPIEKDSIAKELEPLRNIFTKSIYASTFLPAGTVLSHEHLQLKKPGNGLPAEQLPNIIGQKLRCSLQADQLILLENILEVLS